MSAEIICVGTEILLGDILNTNAQFLAKELAALGIPHYYQNAVGDNPDRIKQVLQIAASRSQVLIFTGGLGPTPDDLTHETIAEFFGVPLTERPEIIADLTAKYADRRRPMSPSNRKQALLPQGATILPNPSGTAPGIIWEIPQEEQEKDLIILTFPGVPSEMQRMWKETAAPFLHSKGWGENVIYSRTLRFWGIAESALAEKAEKWLALSNPTVAPYASLGQVTLRITAKATSQVEAKQLIAPVEEQLRLMAGVDCFGADEDSLASVVGQLLEKHNFTLAVAESCTGGGVGQMLTEIPGSSSYFLGGVISYDNQVKISLLGVNAPDLAQLGAVSDTVAEQMALGVQSALGASWGLSITGIAGPAGGSENKPVGLVYIGIAHPNGEVESFEYRFSPVHSRSLIRHLSICTALDLLRRKLLSVRSDLFAC